MVLINFFFLRKNTKQPTQETTSFTYHFCLLEHQETLTYSYSQLNVLTLHTLLTRLSLTGGQTQFDLWNLFILFFVPALISTFLMILKSPKIIQALIISNIPVLSPLISISEKTLPNCYLFFFFKCSHTVNVLLHLNTFKINQLAFFWNIRRSGCRF